MAALLIVGALAIADKVEQKKEKKRAKKANDEKRYRELQLETNQRLTRRESGTTGAAIDNGKADLPLEDSSEDEVENQHVAGNDVQPPAYEDAVAAGERREREWKAQMQRRRSSAYSQGSEGGKARLMKMG